jgi:hypothetical protein
MEQVIFQREDVSEVLEWLTVAATKKQNVKEFSATLDRKDRNWLYFATRLRGPEDVYDRAILLQSLEDDWEAEHPNSIWKLLLLPTA